MHHRRQDERDLLLRRQPVQHPRRLRPRRAAQAGVDRRERPRVQQELRAREAEVPAVLPDAPPQGRQVDVLVLGGRQDRRRRRRAREEAARAVVLRQGSAVPPRFADAAGGRERGRTPRAQDDHEQRSVQGRRGPGVQQGQGGRQAARRADRDAVREGDVRSQRHRAPAGELSGHHAGRGHPGDRVLDAAVARQPARERVGHPERGRQEGARQVRQARRQVGLLRSHRHGDRAAREATPAEVDRDARAGSRRRSDARDAADRGPHDEAVRDADADARARRRPATARRRRTSARS